jgi:nicotinate-nucleotide adenylyltransferase
MGGTFDPIHQGHIQAALQVSQLFAGTNVSLLPAKVPVHKDLPIISVAHRLAMLELAVLPYHQLLLDLREIQSADKSYTYNTLRHLREELGDECPLVMVIGMDSFLTLPQWYKVESFLNYCHIVVLQRPKYHRQNNSLPDFVKGHLAQDAAQLSVSKAGKVLFFSQDPIDISATHIRGQVVAGQIAAQVPELVSQYITQHNLYKSL